ncbi:NAD(P)-dependent oxidoreductase [Niabella sp. CJ426]|uniref:NAD(P)-dependent oxidoreductase n=1 Tax=Niabella sp. CJ426 TaxID=3393740 RepID=UPI003D036439
MIFIPKIAVIGGTGKSGQYLSQELIRQEIPFRILLRNPQGFEIKSPLATVVQGDARELDAIRRLLEGCDTVISMLGQPAGEPPIFSQATRNILAAMQLYNNRRYIVITGLNVDATADHKSHRVKAATEWMKTHYPQTTADKQLEYEVLSKSSIDWTMIRLPMIQQSDDEGPLAVSLTDCPGEQISAGRLARFVINLLHNGQYIQQAPFIANAE